MSSSQLSGATPADEPQEMADQVCLVTGASRGIGFYTARGLAAKGAHVILVGHHQGRGEKALQRIRDEVKGASAEFMLADPAIQDEILGLAHEFQNRYDRLDVLVNNVGGFFMRRQETPDGLEMTFALNHMSYFMITNLLYGNLREGEIARIVNVSSEAHQRAQIHFDDLQLEEGYNPQEAYGQSKLANLLFTYELARRLEASRITANALHPGFVNTHIAEQNLLISPFVKLAHFLFGKSPKEGAETPVYLASSPEVEGITGEYFIDKEITEPSPASRREEDGQRLWRISEELCGIKTIGS